MPLKNGILGFWLGPFFRVAPLRIWGQKWHFFWRPKSCKQAPRRSFYPMWDIKPILDLSWRYLKKDFRIFRNFYFLSTSFSKKCLNCHILHICNIRKGAPGCSFFPMVDIKPIMDLHWCYLKWKFRIHWNFYFISTKNPRWPTWS